MTSSSGSLFVPRNYNFTPVSAYASDIVPLCHHSNVSLRPCSYSFSSQERFDSLSSFYCRGARAAIICYDLTDRASFESLQGKWVKKVMEEAELGCHICIVGTKLDLIQEPPNKCYGLPSTDATFPYLTLPPLPVHTPTPLFPSPIVPLSHRRRWPLAQCRRRR